MHISKQILAASPMLDRFSRGHAQLLSLCAHLEDIADTLLSLTDTGKCDRIADSLPTLIASVCRYEEDVLFPWLNTNYSQHAGIGKSLTRLYFEHLEDQAYAGEVAEMLRQIGAQKRFETETAGYMFRGFFEGMRRHIAFEQDHLYHLISYQNPASRGV